MADDDLVTIGKYGLPQDAHLARGVLAGEGVRACVVDDATTGWLWYLGTALGGAKLQVARRDVAEAKEILHGDSSATGETSGGSWTCPRCGAEIDAGFEVCWSCEAPRGEIAAVDGPAVAVAHSAQVSEECESASDPTAAADANATRAFRTAVFGIFFPPLLFYAAYLLVKIMGRDLSPAATRKFYAALAICLVLGVLWWRLVFQT